MQQVFIGNLQFDATEDDLREAFESEGLEVQSARIVRDVNNHNKSKGFGFVTLADGCSTEDAIDRMNDYAVLGRKIRVDNVRAKARA